MRTKKEGRLTRVWARCQHAGGGDTAKPILPIQLKPKSKDMIGEENDDQD